MDLQNKTLNALISKDNTVSNAAAQEIINKCDTNAFSTLVEKSPYLFDFVKNNISLKFSNAVNENNYKNILSFLPYYSPDYEDFIVNSLVKYADEDLTDKMLDILEKGNPYCALYFSKIPDTVALNTLQNFYDSSDEALLINSAKALGAMQDEESYNKALRSLESDDEFDILRGVKFLVNYGNKNVLDNLFKVMYKSGFSENIACEIAYFKDLRTMLDDERALDCLDILINSLGEVIPLQSVFDFQLYETLADLMQGDISSQKAKILLKAKVKFNMFTENSQYTFDEDKNTKDEIKEITKMLSKLSDKLISKSLDELEQTDFRILSELQLIKELKADIAEEKILNLVRNSNEIIVCEAVSTLKSLGKINKIQNKEEILNNLKDKNIRAIVHDCFA